MIGEAAFIDQQKIQDLLAAAKKPEKARLTDILQKARVLKGLCAPEIAELLSVNEPQQLQQIFETASFIKSQIYGERLVLFAPLYISNLCQNDCAYCAFRVRNKQLKRRALAAG